MFIRKYFFHFLLNDEPAANTGAAPAAKTQPITPEPTPVPTEPSTATAKLSEDDIARIVARLQAQNKEAEEPPPELKTEPTPELKTEPTPELKTEPTPPTDDPRDQTMRSLLIKANQVPESLVSLLPKDPTEAQAMIESSSFQQLMARERQAAQINAPAPDAPKPKAPEGDANTAPVQPKTFAEITTDHLNEISAFL